MSHTTALIPNPEAVDCSVHIEITRPSDLNKRPSYQYLDPDELGSWWNSDALEPIDKGMVVEYTRGVDGRIKIHLPYRYVDADVISSLRGLKSYKTSEPALVQRLRSTRMEQDPRTGKQDFSLSETDYEQFRRRIAQKFWIVRKDEVNVTQLLARLTELIERINELTLEIPPLRRKYCLPDSPVAIKSELILEAAQGEFRNRERQLLRVREERQALTRQLDKLNGEAERKREYDRVKRTFDRLTEAIEGSNTIDFTRYIREIDSRHRVALGQNTKIHLQSHTLTLGEELALLQKHFPVLKHLRVEDSKIIFPLTGAKFILSDSGLEFFGTTEAVEQYRGGAKVGTDKRERGPQRLRSVRRRAPRKRPQKPKAE